jgi:linoleoyl-CoA desaturase
MGGCSLSWHQEHVVRHHGHTNVLGEDPDVYASQIIRLHPEDKWHWWQRWQHYYAIPLYSLMWVHWVYNDLVNAIFNTYRLQGRKYWQFWMQIFAGLVPHIIVGWVLPYLAFHNLWLVGIGYTAFFMSLSIAMAMTFVLAHVSDGGIFYLSNDEEQKDWAIHQLETTMDFAVENRFLTWLLGGLNFQVEHHIFPSICHLHYPQIQKIVKHYCLEKNIPYREEKTIRGAVLRHLIHLKTMSKPAVSFVRNRLHRA